jgi:hypothetical protein
MSIKGILLAGAALCTIAAAAPALAKSAPHVHVLALHPGAVTKTAMHSNRAGDITYTFYVSTAVSTASSYKVKTNLGATFYTWLSNSSLCQEPKKEKLSLSTKKTKYAKLSTGVETYSEGCGTPNKFYGTVYDLTSKTAAGKVDTFVSDLKAKFKNSNGKEDGSLFIDISVAIES